MTLPGSHQMLGNPLLQYQLLLNSLLLPMTSPPGNSDNTIVEETLETAGIRDLDDYLRMTSFSNQLAIIQLNKLVTQLVDGENKEEENKSQKEEQMKMEFQVKLLNQLEQGFKLLSKEINKNNNLITNITDSGEVEQAIQAVGERLVNASLNVTSLRNELHNLNFSHTCGLQDLVVALQMGALEAVSDDLGGLTLNLTTSGTNNFQGILSPTSCKHARKVKEATTKVVTQMLNQQNDLFADSMTTVRLEVVQMVNETRTAINEDLNNLTYYVQNFSNTATKQSEEALELAQNTAIGVMQLQADLYSIMEKLNSSTAKISPDAPASRCPEYFIEVEEECFYISKPGETLYWDQGRKLCRNIGGDLAVPSNVLTFILAVRNHVGERADRLWVGGREHEVEATPDPLRSDTSYESELQNGAPWYWLTEVEVDHGWLKGQPSGNTGESNCLTVS
ncbi:putative Perlucin-like 5, partial [Homarus americanus]